MSRVEGRDFWADEVAFEELAKRTLSGDPFERWAAAFELGELGDSRAVTRLRELISDDDEYVRHAAESALVKVSRSGEALAGAKASVCAPMLGPIESQADVPPYIPWKIKPLAAPNKDNKWAVDAALAEIIETEGPILGKRLIKVFSTGVEINTGKRGIYNAPLGAGVRRLVARGRVVRCDDFVSDKAEHWVVHRMGSPEVCVRQRGSRALDEIPVNEVREVLLASGGLRVAGRIDRDRAFKRLISFYQADRELYVIGRLLADEWAGLLD